jgi:hypothetical protein
MSAHSLSLSRSIASLQTVFFVICFVPELQHAIIPREIFNGWLEFSNSFCFESITIPDSVEMIGSLTLSELIFRAKMISVSQILGLMHFHIASSGGFVENQISAEEAGCRSIGSQ